MLYQVVKFQAWNRKSIVTHHSKWSRGRQTFFKACQGDGYDVIYTDDGTRLWAHVMIPGNRDFTICMHRIE